MLETKLARYSVNADLAVVEHDPVTLPDSIKIMDDYKEPAINQQTAFDEALDAAEKLDAEDQAELAALLSRRLAERGRERVSATVEQARREFAAGQCQPITAAEIVREAQLCDAPH